MVNSKGLECKGHCFWRLNTIQAPLSLFMKRLFIALMWNLGWKVKGGQRQLSWSPACHMASVSRSDRTSLSSRLCPSSSHQLPWDSRTSSPRPGLRCAGSCISCNVALTPEVSLYNLSLGRSQKVLTNKTHSMAQEAEGESWVRSEGRGGPT